MPDLWLGTFPKFDGYLTATPNLDKPEQNRNKKYHLIFAIFGQDLTGKITHYAIRNTQYAIRSVLQSIESQKRKLFDPCF
jgi:hypothetical protein